MSEPTAVVTCFLRHRGDVLLLRRAEDATTYPGVWGVVTGYLEHDDPMMTARMEVREETRLADVVLVREGTPYVFVDKETDNEWRVHPMLFDVETREVTLNEESTSADWTSPTEILRRETVPELWTSYDRVRPTPQTISADTEHGSATISIRTLEVLRDEAGIAATTGRHIEDVGVVAEDLLEARPSMAALRNRVNRVMAKSSEPEAIEAAAIEAIRNALGADDDAAAATAEVIQGQFVLTLSRSGTVMDALFEADAPVIVAESRPAREGVGVAERLAADGVDVTLCTDAAVAHHLAEEAVDVVVVGADTILPDGRVVNKTGTRGMAIAATREDVPVYVAAASDKITTTNEPFLESGSPADVYDGPAALHVANPTFDVTPTECVDGVITERGILTDDDIRDIVAEFESFATWHI